MKYYLYNTYLILIFNIYMRNNFETTSQNYNRTLSMSVPVFMEKNLGFEFHSVFIYNYEADFR